MIKAIKIGKDIGSFLNEHPEIKVFKIDGKIKFILLLEEIQLISLIIIDNCICDLQFCYNGEYYQFSKKEETRN